jgi:hypothetical protein
MGQMPHTWYALVNRPVVDLDLLSGRQSIDAVLARVLRLRSGGKVILEYSCDLSPLRARPYMADPGGYGFSVLQQGMPRWRLEMYTTVALNRVGAHPWTVPEAGRCTLPDRSRGGQSLHSERAGSGENSGGR